MRTLFAHIHCDPRHADIHELCCQAITARSFGAWGMACLHEDSIDKVSHARLSQVLARVAAAAVAQRLGKDAHRLLKDLGTSIDEQAQLACLPRAA